jgi:hypothetical protein
MNIYTKKVYKLIKIYPGIDNKLNVGDCFIKIYKTGFYQLIEKNTDNYIFQEHTYVTVDCSKHPEYFEEITISFNL